MSKEDLLAEMDEQVSKCSYDGWYDDEIPKQCTEIANKYAKQVAIEFANFKADYHRIEGINMRHEQNKIGGIVTWRGDSDEKIWEAFEKGEQLRRYYETEKL